MEIPDLHACMPVARRAVVGKAEEFRIGKFSSGDVRPSNTLPSLV